MSATAAAEATLYTTAFRRGFELERQLTVTEWADTYRVLSSVSSASPGQYRSSRIPYIRGFMDAISPMSRPRRVVVMKASQLGFSDALYNLIGYGLHLRPGPVLLVMPTSNAAKTVSKQRIAPMIEATPVLRDLVKDHRSRDSKNTLLSKEVPGGILMLAGANSAIELRNRPARDLICDEIDAFPDDVDGEGDPIMLAEARSATFSRTRTEVLVSSPTFKGSRIEREYAGSDRRRYFIPCRACGHMDCLTFDGADRVTEDGRQHHRIEYDAGRPETARMVCSECRTGTDERWKSWMLARGEWRRTAEEWDGLTVGFHLSSLYSPPGWLSWAEIAASHRKATQDRSLLKAFVNTVLGECWEERGERVKSKGLKARIEDWAADVPVGVGGLVAAVDVQDDRLEVLVKGFDSDEQSWMIDFKQLYGDTSQRQVWFDLGLLLGTVYKNPHGHELKIDAVAVDTGGHRTEEAYRFVRGRLGESPRTYAIKGGNVPGLPLVQRPTTRNRYHVPLYSVCSDTGNEIVFARLKIETPGPGYIHLRKSLADDEYLAQLAAERPMWKYMKGRGRVQVWDTVRERNEAFDLEKYALAALYILGPAYIKDLAERARTFSAPLPDNATPASEAPELAGSPRSTRLKFARRRQGIIGKL